MSGEGALLRWRSVREVFSEMDRDERRRARILWDWVKKVVRDGRRLVNMEGRANERSRWAFPGTCRS